MLQLKQISIRNIEDRKVFEIMINMQKYILRNKGHYHWRYDHSMSQYKTKDLAISGLLTELINKAERNRKKSIY